MALRAASGSVSERLQAVVLTRERLRAGSLPPSAEHLGDPYIRAHPLTSGCTIYSIQGVAGIGTAGCAITGLDRGWRE